MEDEVEVHVTPIVTEEWSLVDHCPCYNKPDTFNYAAKMSDSPSGTPIWNATFEFYMTNDETNERGNYNFDLILMRIYI